MTSSDIAMPPSNKVNLAEWAITLLILTVLSAAYLGAQEWPHGTAFFPILLSGTGIVLVVVKLAAMALGRDPSAYLDIKQEDLAGRDSKPSDVGNLAADEDLAGEDDMQADFVAAPLSAGLRVIGWVSVFFIGLYALGLLIVLPVFTALYLRVAAQMTLVGIFIYVLGTSGLIYLLFVVVLHLPLPEGELLMLLR